MDKEYFSQAIEESAEMMYRIAFTILRHDEDCKDAMQQAALKAWEKRDTLRNPAYFRTWMTRILINACYDIQRTRKRVILMDEMPASAVPPPDPALAIALQSLPEDLRLPLVLHYAEGMTCQQVAQTLRLPPSTVRGRIHRAALVLRKELNDDEA